MSGSVRVGTFAGVTLWLHLSWLLFGVLLVYSLAEIWLPALYPDWPSPLFWGAGGLAVLFVFISVLIHEAMNAWYAHSRGFLITMLTLFIFGGISDSEQQPERPVVELQLACIGPLTSLLLGGIFALLWLTIRQVSSLFGAILGFLALVNGLLGLINLLPSFPLDGGRVLRSIIWMVTGSVPVATRLTTLVSQGMALFLILAGFGVLLLGEMFTGIWLAFLGWFLFAEARAADIEMLRETVLEGRQVEEIMDPHPSILPATLSLQKAIQEYFLRTGRRGAFIIEGDQLAGLLTLADLRHFPQEQWETMNVSQAMLPVKQIWSVSPHQSARDALLLMVKHRVNQVPVVEGNRLIGVVSRGDILRFADVRRILGVEMESTGSRN